MRQAFFIVGSPRSGTTLMRQMLNAHPMIAVPPETHFGDRYVKKRARFGADGDPAARAALLEEFSRSAAFEQMQINESAFAKAAATHLDDPWWPLRVAMEGYGHVQEKQVIGEKTPGHTLHINALAEAFPEARFLMVRRDPRAVAASWARVAWKRHTSLEVAELWRRYSKAMRAARRSLPGRCLELHFERLVSAPEQTLREVAAFLGLAYHPSMLDYPDRMRTSDDDVELTFSSPQESRIAAWRSTLSREDVLGIEAICAGEMARAGYSRETGLAERTISGVGANAMFWRRRAWRRVKALLR